MLVDDNRRNFQRINIDCPATVRSEAAGPHYDAVVKNLSGNGFLLWLAHELAEGEICEVTVAPTTPITPPMTARVRVVRCTPVPGHDGQFELACAIDEILPPEPAE